ncbi:carboxyl-terminal processing protease [Haloactinopolyspora alba]|uniref:Carboxyl-terminal processing protease n=1 Tax=Haloactinopolyspora alba TaxID=648780 RepID=A0A2P8DXZ5_9ACTN|nr:S41 family peptidase [Haloactinopolyspora alba]PSL02099.1 carboxyl-terminal processing protease [Haloactinopolyspora alba]
MLPSFHRPVLWRLDHLPDRDDVLPLLELEAAEFTAVLGQPVRFHRADDGDRETDVWDVAVAPDVGSPRLECDPESRRLALTVPDPSAFGDGVNLLHSLAHSASTMVSDTETKTCADAFDRIHAEVANIYPSFGLRDLDWGVITERYEYVRDLDGDEFWAHAARWVAELGDAHTQLIFPGPRFHPPYVAEMIHPDGAVLRKVPEDSAAWAVGVRPGHTMVVDDPAAWLRTVGASPQQHALIAARRFMAMSAKTRDFTATASDGTERSWTETRRARPSVAADGNWIRIAAFTPDVPEQLHEALAGAHPDGELTLDLRGNTGGSLVAAAQARRLFVRDETPFGSVAFTTGRGDLAAAVDLRTSPDPDAWPGTVRVLVDAMTYSAAEDFLHPLVGAPHVSIAGGPTGGGSGRPHTRLLKDGARLAVSTAITYTRDGRPIEYRGIQPTRSLP